MTEEPDYPPQSPVVTGILGRCPRCGQGRMFSGFINLAPRCETCGLDYGFADSGDGPAVFVCLLAGFVVLGIALWAELSFEPPIWVQLVIFLPLTLIVCLGMLRPLKGLLIAQQFRTKAEDAQHPRL
jgi:uncharacterized protein (DUF983 family)